MNENVIMEPKELEKEFDDMGLTISKEMIDRCVVQCISHQISAADLVGSWVAYCASSQIDSNDLTEERLSIVVKSFQNDKDRDDLFEKKTCENLARNRLMEDINDPETSCCFPTIDLCDDIEENAKNTSSGAVVCKFGNNINATIPSADIESFSLLNTNWDKFVFGQINHKKYDTHVQKLAEDIKEKNFLFPIKSFTDPSFGFGEATTIAGCLKYIRSELFLCSSDGRIQLDLTEAIKTIGQLFVNQIVVVIGQNTESKIFKATQLFTEAPLPLSTKLPTFQGNLNLIVAAGPFFSEGSSHGKSLKSLIQKTIESEAKILILLGPIFETDFGTKLNLTSTESIQKCYDDLLDAILKPLFNNPSTQNTKVLMLSSWKDVGPYGFYPTPPNTESQLPVLYPNNVFMVSDPSLFSVNDIIIAANACDSLIGLHMAAINRHKEETFTKLAKQIVGQRSVHPSYTSNPHVPIDQALWLEHSTLQNNTPHIILMSSQLRTFIRAVEGSMVINVGHLVKNNPQKEAVSGTYGKIQISPAKDNTWSSKTNVVAQIINL